LLLQLLNFQYAQRLRISDMFHVFLLVHLHNVPWIRRENAEILFYLLQKTGFPVKKLSNRDKAQISIYENILLVLMCNYSQEMLDVTTPVENVNQTFD